MSSNIPFSRLIPYVDEVIENHQRGFRRNRSTTDQISWIHQLGRKMGVYWDSTSVIYRIWEGVWLSQGRNIVQYSHWIWCTYEINWLIKTYLNETYIKSAKVKICITNFLIRMVWSKEDALLPLLFNFALEYSVRRVQEIYGQIGIEWNTSPPGLCWRR